MNKSNHPHILGATIALLLTTTACDEFATPAELSKAQILAIQADPPGVTPGQTAALEVLVADRDGVIESPDVTWEITTSSPEQPPLGAIGTDERGRPVFVAPADIPTDPSLATVSASVAVDQATLTGLKLVAVGSFPLSNPTLSELTVDGQAAPDTGSMTLARGQTVPIAVEFESAAEDTPMFTPTFGWYSTVGEIERYQSNPAELVVQDEPGDGVIIIVVRDGLGGVVWTEVAIAVE